MPADGLFERRRERRERNRREHLLGGGSPKRPPGLGEQAAVDREPVVADLAAVIAGVERDAGARVEVQLEVPDRRRASRGLEPVDDELELAGRAGERLVVETRGDQLLRPPSHPGANHDRHVEIAVAGAVVAQRPRAARIRAYQLVAEQVREPPGSVLEVGAFDFQGDSLQAI
jgi:hypothetical protein